MNGTAILSRDPSFTSFSACDGSSDTYMDLIVNSDGKVYNPKFVLNSNSNFFSLNMGQGSYFGSEAGYSEATSWDTQNIVVSNDYPVMGYESWVAMRKSGAEDDGRTYYSADGGQTFFQVDGQDYSGPINFFGINLTINDGAVVDGANFFEGSQIYINSGGTLKNSSVFGGSAYADVGSISSNNRYFNNQINGPPTGLSISDHDTLYLVGNTTGHLNLSQYPGLQDFSINGQSNDNLQLPPKKYNDFRIVNRDPSGNKILVFSDYPDFSYTDQPVCYLSGTLILCEAGEVCVEDLRCGDRVYVYDGSGGRALREVIWVGHQRHCARDGFSADMSGYPVRIMKDALSEGVPHKDFLVTPEHCLYLEGRFIPARMLVNGRTIYYDRTLGSYDYYHVELEEHSVIMADGVLSESYLDTGNRRYFHPSDNVVRLRAGGRTWSGDAAAPLGTERSVVEPLYRRYEERACFLGIERCEETAVQVLDPDLYLLTPEGHVIYPRGCGEGQRYRFMLPPDISHVHIHSRSSRPCDAVGPYVDDRRELGVLVGEVVLFDRDRLQPLHVHLSISRLCGWHGLENDRCRWTSGYAFLPLPEGSGHRETLRVLVIEILQAGPYVQKQEAPVFKKRVNA